MRDNLNRCLIPPPHKCVQCGCRFGANKLSHESGAPNAIKLLGKIMPWSKKEGARERKEKE